MFTNAERALKITLLWACTMALCCLAALAQAAPLAYVVNRQDSNVSVVDVAHNRVVSTIPAGMASPHRITISQDGRRAYLSSIWSTTLTVLDLDKRSLLTRISLNATSNGVALHPHRPLAYADTNTPGGAMIAVIDTSTQQVLRSFASGAQKTQGLALSPDGERLYSLEPQNDPGSARVTVIDPLNSAVLDHIRIGAEPTAIKVHPSGGFVYVLHADSHGNQGSVTVIDTRTHTVSASVAVGRSPSDLAFHPAGSQAYVINQGDSTVAVMDTRKHAVAAWIALGSAPQQVAFNPLGTHAYVSNQGGNTMSVIDTATQQLLETVPVGSSPWGIGVADNAPSPALAALRVAAAQAEHASPSGAADTASQQALHTLGSSKRSGVVQSVPVSGVWAGLLLVVSGIATLHHLGRKLLD